MTASQLVDLVWEQYAELRRDDLAWRTCFVTDTDLDPYKVMVSEIMLQQTQVSRVQTKFDQFLTEFPDMRILADASFQEVLQVWTGLGYTRRAKYLHDIAKQLHSAQFPRVLDELVALKGIGKNTAAAILTYAYNQKYVFIETNIRTVLLHHMYADKDEVSDKQLEATMAQVLELLADGEYRDFYWAMMDYGTHLKSTGVRTNAQSKHYAKQSKFEGSRRQIRGRVMKLLATEGVCSVDELSAEIQDKRLDEVLADLHSEGLVIVSQTTVSLQ